MSHCKIHLQKNDNNVIYSGSEICGRLECVFLEKDVVNCIKVQLIGRETTVIYVFRKSRPFYGINTFLAEEIILLSPKKGVQEYSSGKYVYDFCFKLRPNLPSSLRIKHGKVIYVCRGIVVKPILRRNFEDILTLNIKSPVNLVPDHLNESVKMIKKESFLSFFECKTRKIAIKLELRRNFFVIDENLQFQAEIKNNSGRLVSKICIRLIRVVRVTVGNSKTRFLESLTVLEEVREGVESGNARRFEEKLKFPGKLEIFAQDSLKFISVRYFLVVKCHVSGSRGVEAKVEIVLGNN